MKTDLDHLPARKQRELDRVVQIISQEFEDALARAPQPLKKKGRIEKILLYGSHARGGWVDEPHTAKGYRSDFDLLIIVNDKRLTEQVDCWFDLEDRFVHELVIDLTLRTPVNFIVHTLEEVNDALVQGRYFFMDVARDAIALYEFDACNLHTPQPKTPEQALALAREYFDDCYPSSASFKRASEFLAKEGGFLQAIFNLHQATECLYQCVLLVCTFYTPHVHNLAFLRKQAERIDRRLMEAWPRGMRAERARFQKLKDAYVKARYSKHYRITQDEFLWLGGCVEALSRAVHVTCSERIVELEAKAAAAP